MKPILLLLFLLSTIYSKENISLSKILYGYQGNEYNVLLSPRQIVTASRMKKTKKAVKKGFIRAIQELKRQVRIRDIDFNLKIFTARGSNLSQYRELDIQSHDILKNMLSQQVQIREQLFEDDDLKDTTNIDNKLSVDDIDVDFGEDAFDISNDIVTVEGKTGVTINISPEDAFKGGYLELSELYNQEVLKFYDVEHPFKVGNKPIMKKVHSVFGMAFFPTKYGSIKMMKIYVLLCNINSESNNSIQIIAKEIPTFKWDRNYLFVSAATGKVLRQIVSGVLGEPFALIK